MRKKLKDTGGLTMVEMLCAVAILVLLCLMMNTGISMAVKSYQDITAESETQLLLSSLSDALADKLRYCVVTDNGDGSYTTSIGAVTVSPAPPDPTAPSAIPEGVVLVGGNRLLPDSAYGDSGGGYIGKYTVTEAEVKPAINGTTVTFEVKLKLEAASAGVKKELTLTVRCLNPVKEETP